MPVELAVPGSKSLTQRALVVAALADGPLALPGALDCDDARALTGLLRSLGVGVHWPAAGGGEGAHDAAGPGAGELEPGAQRTVRVQPAPLCAAGERIDCGNAGTALRFGACLSLLTDGPLLLDGNARMRERPVGGLGDALAALGVAVSYEGRPGCPPLRLERRGPASPAVEVDVSRSSQFASGLLLVAPRLPRGLRLTMTGSLVSLPYVTMTTRLMARAGAAVSWEGERTVLVGPGGYRAAALPGGRLEIEPDWSSAAFLLVAGRLLGVEVDVPGLLPPGQSLQGDAALVEHLAELDRPRSHTLDLGPTPDLLPPLAVAALFADHPTRIHGVAHARLKESDRLAVLAHGFGRAGARVAERADGLEITPLAAPPPPGTALLLDPAGDHRMAMAFGLLGLRVPGVRTADPGCVSKSFPGFWGTLERLRQAGRAGQARR